jgi:hypothetical protein
MTTAMRASAGQSRSQRMLQRARRNARLSCARASASPVRDGAARWLDEVSVNGLSAENPPNNAATKGQFNGAGGTTWALGPRHAEHLSKISAK